MNKNEMNKVTNDMNKNKNESNLTAINLSF